MSLLNRLIILVLALMLSHCMSYDFSRRVVQQGNLLPESKIKQLKLGMSQEETISLLGTSLINAPFNNNRLDYAYTIRRANQPLVVRRISLSFVHDKLVKIDSQ